MSSMCLYKQDVYSSSLLPHVGTSRDLASMLRFLIHLQGSMHHDGPTLGMRYCLDWPLEYDSSPTNLQQSVTRAPEIEKVVPRVMIVLNIRMRRKSCFHTFANKGLDVFREASESVRSAGSSCS